MKHITVLATVEWIACFIIGCIQLVAYLKYRSSDLHIIRKRIPGIVRTKAVLLIICLFFVFPLIFKEQMDIIALCAADSHSITYCQNLQLSIDILAVITRPVIHLLILLEAARLWLIFYR